MIRISLCSAFLALALTLPALEPAVHWKLDEEQGITVHGSGPKAVSGKRLNPANTAWGKGRLAGKCLHLKGDPGQKRQGGTVVFPLNDRIDFTKPFTLMLWFQPSHQLSRTSGSELVSNALGDRGPGFRLVFSWNTIRLISGDGKKSEAVAAIPARTSIQRDIWHHLAVTYDGKQVRLYHNGILAAESPDTKPFVITPGRPELNLGSYRNGAAYAFIGALSDVRIFERSLSPKEILTEAKNLDTVK